MTASALMNLPVDDRPSEDAARERGASVVLTTAEVAECTCPDWCERDHDRD